MLLKEMLSCSATGVKYSQKYPKSSKQEKIWESIIKNKLHKCVNKKNCLNLSGSQQPLYMAYLAVSSHLLCHL